jgi:hypothetical protein
MPVTNSTMKALDRLKKAANLVPTKKVVELSDGSEFEFYCAPLTMAEREKAQKDAGTDEATAFALQLWFRRLRMPTDNHCSVLVKLPN